MHARPERARYQQFLTAQWVKDAERLVELDRELPAILRGERKPASPTETLEYGQLCVYK